MFIYIYIYIYIYINNGYFIEQYKHVFVYIFLYMSFQLPNGFYSIVTKCITLMKKYCLNTHTHTHTHTHSHAHTHTHTRTHTHTHTHIYIYIYIYIRKMTESILGIFIRWMKTVFMSRFFLSFIIILIKASLIGRIPWMVSKMGGKWPYSSCF